MSSSEVSVSDYRSPISCTINPGSDDQPEYRHIAAFADRETADEWWRMISTPTYSGDIERISPQLYVHDRYHFNDISPSRISKKVVVMSLDTTYATIPITLPPVVITDHISGGWYFIRSKADPWSHWYLRIDGDCLVCGSTNCDAIHVSSEYRTRFCVRVRDTADGSQTPEDFVMIRSDKISIAAPKGFILHIDDEGNLRATKGYQGEADLLFGDLKKRFIARAEKQVNGEIWEYVESVERGLGEPWELVD